MSDVKKIATREAYGKTLAELGAEIPNLVVLDCDLAGATKTSVFKKSYPERHIDCGIAESNMMSIAAGLAAAGMVPFASTFAMFAAGRAFEQIRNSIGYPHLNVKIGASHALSKQLLSTKVRSIFVSDVLRCRLFLTRITISGSARAASSAKAKM